MSNEHYALEAEISELEDMLSTLPPEQIISRLGLEARLESVKVSLKELGAPLPPKEKLLLTFRGRPVDGSKGIVAEFGGKAIEAFSSAIGTVMASINGDLADRGPLPKRDEEQLMITGTATGSFGFEIEVPSKNSSLFEDEDEMVGVTDVVEVIQDLFEIAAQGTDDELTEVVDVIHPRAVKKVYEFLSYLEGSGAYCGLNFKGKSFKFASTSQLSNAILKLKEQNVHEDKCDFEGRIIGILPHSKMFEFYDNVSNLVIKGKIDSKKIETEELSRKFLNIPVKVFFRVVRVGEGKPKYTLMEMSDITEMSGNTDDD